MKKSTQDGSQVLKLDEAELDEEATSVGRFGMLLLFGVWVFWVLEALPCRSRSLRNLCVFFFQPKKQGQKPKGFPDMYTTPVHRTDLCTADAHPSQQDKKLLKETKPGNLRSRQKPQRVLMVLLFGGSFCFWCFFQQWFFRNCLWWFNWVMFYFLHTVPIYINCTSHQIGLTKTSSLELREKGYYHGRLGTVRAPGVQTLLTKLQWRLRC